MVSQQSCRKAGNKLPNALARALATLPPLRRCIRTWPGPNSSAPIASAGATQDKSNLAWQLLVARRLPRGNFVKQPGRHTDVADVNGACKGLCRGAPIANLHRN